MNNERNILNVNIEDIIPNRFQPRLAFDEKSLNELSKSIKEHGIIQPLIVRPLNDKYEIIAGERRYKAATIAGLQTVPVIITNLTDTKSAEVAVIENIQRKDLNPIEEAKSYKRILNRCHKTQEELASDLGVSQSTIANKLRLLTLTEDAIDALFKGNISERHARSLLKVENEINQKELLNKTINNKLTVKQLEEEIKKLSNESNILKEEIITEELIKETNNETINNDTLDLDITPNEIPIKSIFDIQNSIGTSEKNIFDEIQENSSNKEELLPKNDIMIDNQNEEENAETLENLDILDGLTETINDDSVEVLQNEKNNIFDFGKILEPKEKKEYPSLDDLITNMNLGIESEYFNPFKEDDNIVEESVEESKDKEQEQTIEIGEAVELSPKEEISAIIPNDLESIKTAFNKLIEEIKNAGFKINNEEFDFTDLYQLIIKIDK